VSHLHTVGPDPESAPPVNEHAPIATCSNAEVDPLADASREELEACAQLLAASIARHNARLGARLIRPDSRPALAVVPGGRPLPALSGAAAATLSEALGIVRGATPPAAEPPPAAPVREQRRQLRVAVNAPARIVDGNGTAHRVNLRNISWGGAEIHTGVPVGEVQDHVHLLLPAGKGEHIDILALILRRGTCADGIAYGLRFDSLSPCDEDRLEQVLRVLLDSPGNEGRRAEARLVQRLEIEYGDAGELQATLEDISASGLMLTVPERLEPGQSLLISLSSADCDLGLKLRARVVHRSAFGHENSGVYRVGLAFEHPTPQLRERVAAVIRQLAMLRPQPANDAGDKDFATTAT